MKSDVKKAVFFYYGYTIFFNLLLWIPIFYEFQKRAGLSDPQIFHIQSIYYLAFVLFELPTGYLADKVGKKRSLMLGSFLLFSANLLPLAGQSYLFLLSHFILIAGSRSLISGSASAYLYDYLDAHGESNVYKKYEGKARSLSLIARLLTWPAAGFLLNIHLLAAHSITAIFCLIAFLFSLRLPRELGVKRSTSAFSLKGELSNIFEQLGKAPLLLPLMVQGSGLFIIQRVAMLQLFQPLLKSQNFSVTTFGVVLSLTTLSEAMAASKAHYLKKIMSSDRDAVFVLTIILCGIFLLLGIGPRWSTIPLFMCLGALCGLIFPLQRQLLNDHIPSSDFRATLLSVESIVQRIMASFFTFGIGYMIGNGRLSRLFVFTSLVLMAIIFLVNIFLRRKSLASNRKGLDIT